jgi:hypothetical protein
MGIVLTFHLVMTGALYTIYVHTHIFILEGGFYIPIGQAPHMARTDAALIKKDTEN